MGKLSIRKLTSRIACAAAACAFFVCASASGASAADLGVKLPTVKKIEILGNRSFDDSILKKRMRTKEARFYRLFRQPKYRRDFLRRDAEAIASFYRTNGFFEAKVTVEPVQRNEKKNQVRITLVVAEGPQTRVRALGFSPQPVVPAPVLRKELKLVEGAPYNPNLIQSDQYTLLSRFYEKGYLGAKAVPTARVDTTAAEIDWSLAPGDPVYVRSMRVVGLKTVREGLVRRELVLEPGDLCTTKRMLESTQNLYDTGYFTSAEIDPDSIDLATRRVDLAVKVRERKMGYIETGVGVGNVYGNRIFGEWGQRNIFGTGNVFLLKSQYSFHLFPDDNYSISRIKFRSRYVRNEGEFRVPHVLGTWNTFSIGAFYERDATVEPVVIRDLGGWTRVSRRFSRETSLLVGYSLERIQRLEVEEEKSRSRRRAIDADFSRDTRDVYFNPQRGTYTTLDGRYSGGFLGGDDNYYSLVGVFRHYVGIGKGSVFAYRLRGGYAEAFGASRATGVPIEASFFAGGGNSVRGFEENSIGPPVTAGVPLGGRITVLTNAELRVPLPYLGKYHFGAAFFIDGGGVWNAADEISLKDFRLTASGRVGVTEYMYGAGFGFRYYTPVGPLRLDIGYPLKRTAEMNEGYKVHISLGQIF